MKTHKILSYRIILEPEKIGKKTVYNAFCPTLGIADYGDTIEEALAHMKEGIELALEVAQDEKGEIEADNIEEQVITSIKVQLA